MHHDYKSADGRSKSSGRVVSIDNHEQLEALGLALKNAGALREKPPTVEIEPEVVDFGEDTD